MASHRAAFAAGLAVVACGSPPAPDRDRVLARIPATASLVIAADGRALAHPQIRPLVDALRPELPTALGCVIDAALAGEHVAIGIGSDRAFTIALATRTPVRCPALSQLDDKIWVATLGDGVLRAGATSVADDPRFARARPYLGRAPIAIAAQLAGGKLLATAQPAPFEAWLAIDRDTPAAATELEAAAHAYVKRMAIDPATAPFSHVAIARTGTQVVATLANVRAGDLGLAVQSVLARERAPEPPFTIRCPATLVPPVVECKAAAFRLPPHSELGRELPLAPVVANGVLVGYRIGAPLAMLGLVSGDLIVAIDGRLVTAQAPVRAALARDVALTIRRGTADTVVRLVRSDTPLP
ncbi:MAG: hypothetical protein WKG01_22460 [Kofleriaceae bacterium]